MASIRVQWPALDVIRWRAASKCSLRFVDLILYLWFIYW